VRMNY